MSEAVYLSIPLIPPSVNHYKMRRRDTGHWYVTREALSFKSAVHLFARKRVVTAKKYEVEFTVYLGFRQRGDGDNFSKCVLDGLKEAGVIHSDAAVKRCIANVSRDWKNPRTEITVRAL